MKKLELLIENSFQEWKKSPVRVPRGLQKTVKTQRFLDPLP